MQNDEYLSIRIADPDPISNINFMARGAGFRMEAHSHDFYHINRILDGSVTVEADGIAKEVGAGCIMVLPPSLPHSLYSRTGYKQIGIDVACVEDFRGIFSEIKALCGGFSVKTIPTTAYTAQEALGRMRGLLRDPTKGNILRARNIAEAQILDLLELLRRENDDCFLDRFGAMLSRCVPWQLSLSDMCRILGLCRTELERRAKNAFGCGASEYCARLRYAAVCNLLRSDMPLDGIARETGFCDASHLSRFFAARAGMTPGQYRRIMG